MTGPGGSEADRAAREALAREARATATALLDWVGTRVDGASTRPAGPAGASARPPQSAGPCTWCPVCALVAAVRGEQPELTAHLAEQASALLVVLRLLVQSHAHQHPAPEHAAHEHPAHQHPTPERPHPSPEPAAGPVADPGAEGSGPEVPWDVPPHAMFDPAPSAPTPDGPPRTVPERPTGKRGPRPSPRPRPTGNETPTATAPATPAPATPAPGPSPAPSTPSPAPSGVTRTPAPARSTRGVQRIPVRRKSRPC